MRWDCRDTAILALLGFVIFEAVLIGIDISRGLDWMFIAWGYFSACHP